jgi:hypothetical protein
MNMSYWGLIYASLKIDEWLNANLCNIAFNIIDNGMDIMDMRSNYGHKLRLT